MFQVLNSVMQFIILVKAFLLNNNTTYSPFLHKVNTRDTRPSCLRGHDIQNFLSPYCTYLIMINPMVLKRC